MLFSAFFFTKAAAQGNLLLTPGRVVFEGPKKMQELNLANTGRDTARYLVSFVEIRMKEDGNFEQITQPDSGQYFASNYLRFFPRSVILAPGEAQVVKVQLTKTSQLAAGEYRSHIYFRAVPDEEPLGEKLPAQDPSGISVRLTPVFGITIPAIIRIGASTAAVNLSNAAFERSNDSVPMLSIVLNRTGNMSVYGDLTIDFISSKGKVTQVSEIKGIAVYTPTPSRRIRVALGKFSGIDYKTGKLHVVYKTSSDAKSVTLAETELVLF
jgi:hypothetical protein